MRRLGEEYCMGCVVGFRAGQISGRDDEFRGKLEWK